MSPRTGPTIDSQYKSYLENAYPPIPREQLEKIIDSIMSLMEMSRNRRQSLDAVLEQASRMIFRLFNFHEVSIGLKSREDSSYRYHVCFGQRKDLADLMKKVNYSKEDMFSQDTFPFVMIGKRAQLNPFEVLPEQEKDLFGRTFRLGEKRASFDEFHEGDYIDIWIYGENEEVIGWIELTRPGDGKLPARAAVRWVELIADVLGIIIITRWAEEDSSRR